MNSISKAILSVYSKLFSLKNSRYVNRFVLVDNKYESGRQEITNPQEQKSYDDLKEGTENLTKLSEKYPFIKEINEIIFIEVKDLDSFKLTVEANNGNAKIMVGWNTSRKPTLVLPIYSANLKKLKEITSDKDISLDDVYRFVRGLLVPFLKSLYQADYSNLPKDKSYMKLDNFIHVEVLNENNVEVEGFPGPAQATVVNVDGQWLVFEGLHGDPDIKYSMNIKQALEFVYLIKLKILKHAPSANLSELTPYIQKYNKLKDEVTVYERKWHSVEEI